MKSRSRLIARSYAGFALFMSAPFVFRAPVVQACGGFFCQQVPINQAAEQIIFRQDGDMVTAVVLIQYTGRAEEFSWVVPVPGIPQISVGSDLVFGPLELATRPQFNLQVRGAQCPLPTGSGGASAAPPNSNAPRGDDGAGGVEVLERLAVGPFDVAVVSSDDPRALATWLNDNGYILSDRGRELIGTYVEEECNFVAVRLQQNRDVGDIQPLILRYSKDRPVIPIRLTAVATMPDLGVLVWLLGSARAVPVNYLHVEVNYTLLNWYAGTTNAYASYQGLVTMAMNEAGGQGFATDYAGNDLDVLRQLPSPDTYRAELAVLQSGDLQNFYDGLTTNRLFAANGRILAILRRELPLPVGTDEFIYSSAALLAQVFTNDQLSAARDAILNDLASEVVRPLEESLAVFDGMPYLTRLYTTLSAEEMTVDPAFVFNPDLPGQPLEREATLTLSCAGGQSQWQLQLGPGTGRDGEVVIRGFGSPPLFSPPPAIDQPFVATAARVRSSGPMDFVTVNTFETATVGSPTRGNARTPIRRLCGVNLGMVALATCVTLWAMSLARRRT